MIADHAPLAAYLPEAIAFGIVAEVVLFGLLFLIMWLRRRGL